MVPDDAVVKRELQEGIAHAFTREELEKQAAKLEDEDNG